MTIINNFKKGYALFILISLVPIFPAQNIGEKNYDSKELYQHSGKINLNTEAKEYEERSKLISAIEKMEHSCKAFEILTRSLNEIINIHLKSSEALKGEKDLLILQNKGLEAQFQELQTRYNGLVGDLSTLKNESDDKELLIQKLQRTVEHLTRHYENKIEEINNDWRRIISKLSTPDEKKIEHNNNEIASNFNEWVIQDLRKKLANQKETIERSLDLAHDRRIDDLLLLASRDEKGDDTWKRKAVLEWFQGRKDDRIIVSAILKREKI
jgi:hypothetical protein